MAEKKHMTIIIISGERVKALAAFSSAGGGRNLPPVLEVDSFAGVSIFIAATK